MAEAATVSEYYRRDRFGVKFGHRRASDSPHRAWSLRASDWESAPVKSGVASIDGSLFFWETGSHSSTAEDHLDMTSLAAGAREPIEDRGDMGEFREHLRMGPSDLSSTPSWGDDARDVCANTQNPAPFQFPVCGYYRFLCVGGAFISISFGSPRGIRDRADGAGDDVPRVSPRSVAMPNSAGSSTQTSEYGYISRPHFLTSL